MDYGLWVKRCDGWQRKEYGIWGVMGDGLWDFRVGG